MTSNIILPQKMLDIKSIVCYHWGVPNFRVFYYQGFLGSKQIFKTRSLTEHIPSIMPKNIFDLYFASKAITSNIHVFIHSFWRSTTAFTLVIALVITTLWAHTSQAEAPFLGTEKAVEEKIVDGLTTTERAQKIDAFYIAKGDLPLAGYGLAMVQAADEYGVDWRLVAAIGFIESTGGKFACKGASYSAFGWGSCKINFSSYEESIDVITKNLGGHNPNTARYYKDKTLGQIIDTYNPPYVRPNYKKLVTKTMDQIATIDAPAVLAKK